LPSDSLPRTPRHRIAVSARFAYRLGDAGRTIPPAPGYGVAGTYEYSYAQPTPTLELALGVDFSTDRFATAEKGITATESGATTSYNSTRVILESAFLLTHTVAVRVGPARPFLTLGAGLGIGDLESVDPTYKPGTLRDTQLLGRAAAGIDVVVTRIWRASLRVDYTALRRVDPLLTDAGLSLPVFGDMLEVNLGLVYRF
jgi:hypothetical protein